MATIAEGASVKRGEEIGYFAFGGSTCCILFERARIDKLYITDKEPTSNDGATEANAKTEKNVVQVRQNIALAL